MKKYIANLILIIFFGCISSVAFSSSKTTELRQEIAIAGDSWGVLLCFFGGLDKALETEKINARTAKHCTSSSRIGMTAELWNDSRQNLFLLNQLEQNQNIKVLYLSLGGNDLIKYWNTSMSPDDEKNLFKKIRENTENAILQYRHIRPDIKILISGYDFPRFTKDNKIETYREVYKNLGYPSPLVLNNMLIRYSSYMKDISDQENIFYIHHLGVSEFYKGQSEAGLLALQTLNPDLISAPTAPDSVGGDASLLNDTNSMFHISSFVTDAFHLSPNGYYLIALHSVRLYIKNWVN